MSLHGPDSGAHSFRIARIGSMVWIISVNMHAISLKDVHQIFQNLKQTGKLNLAEMLSLNMLFALIMATISSGCN